MKLLNKKSRMSKTSFVIEYWHWLESCDYDLDEDCQNVTLLCHFYYYHFHNKYPKYEVGPLEFLLALGQL